MSFLDFIALAPVLISVVGATAVAYFWTEIRKQERIRDERLAKIDALKKVREEEWKTATAKLNNDYESELINAGFKPTDVAGTKVWSRETSDSAIRFGKILQDLRKLGGEKN